MRTDGQHSDDQRKVGVVIERRATGSQWQPWSWYPWAVVPPGDDRRWQVLRDAEDAMLFHGGLHTIALHRDQTAYYKQNLSLRLPLVYVALRPAEDAPVEEALEPYHLTLSPDEAQAYVEGDGIVHPVAMPRFLAAWVAQFVAQHHREQEFLRHKRKGGSAGKHSGVAVKKERSVSRSGWEVPRRDD